MRLILSIPLAPGYLSEINQNIAAIFTTPNDMMESVPVSYS